MSRINYELIYKAKDYQDNMLAAQQKISDARDNAKRAEYAWRISLAGLCGCNVSDLYFSDMTCTAEGIRHHVFKGNGARGVGRYHCVFCGCDDFSD